MARWPVVPLHQVMFLRPPDIEVQPDAEYTFAGVFSFGRGVFRGETRLGAEFSYRVLTRVRTDYFTYPKLMAWEGALGVIPPECDGCVVSPEYPVFELDQERMLPRYADIYFRRREVWPMLKAASPGTNVRRRRLHPSAFLELRIPLPSLTEQRQLVAKIDRVAALVDDARCLLREAADEALGLCRALLRGRLHEAFPLVPVGDLVRQRPTDVIVSPDEEYHFAGVYILGAASSRAKGRRALNLRTKSSRASGRATSPIPS